MTLNQRSRTLPLEKRTVVKVKVNGIEKRYKPTRRYVYILQVRWSDFSEYIVYRKYSDFYTFHCGLVEKFPIEAGAIKEESRTLPILPGRMLFSRTEVHKVATHRQVELADYCQDLLALPTKIAQCMDVLDFFEARFEDINPPRDATKKPARSRLALAMLPFFFRNRTVGGLNNESDHTGSSEELNVSGPITLETYVAIADYEAPTNTEVSLKDGDTIEVLEKNDNGWWFVQKGKSHGWAPASYLDPVSHPIEIDEPDPSYTGDLEKYITTEDYKAQFTDEISFTKEVIVEVMHKLLDGWWIICYNGDAGYAPAAYLTPYVNPHLLKSTVKKPHVKPIPRRRTIKTVSSKWKKSSSRDLSLYRKYSKKRPKVERPALNQAPPPPKPPRVVEENEESWYVNTTPDPHTPHTGGATNAQEQPYLEMDASLNSPLYENLNEGGRQSPDAPIIPPREGEKSIKREIPTPEFKANDAHVEPDTISSSLLRKSSSGSGSRPSSPHRVSLSDEDPIYHPIPNQSEPEDEADYATIYDDGHIIIEDNNVEITLARSSASSSISSHTDSPKADTKTKPFDEQAFFRGKRHLSESSGYSSSGTLNSHLVPIEKNEVCRNVTITTHL